jgi:hypothetical protein
MIAATVHTAREEIEALTQVKKVSGAGEGRNDLMTFFALTIDSTLLLFHFHQNVPTTFSWR